MDNQATTRQVLETYYKGFAAKANWESVIADDFEYVGGNAMATPYNLTQTEKLFDICI